MARFGRRSGTGLCLLWLAFFGGNFWPLYFVLGTAANIGSGGREPARRVWLYFTLGTVGAFVSISQTRRSHSGTRQRGLVRKPVFRRAPARFSFQQAVPVRLV